MAKLRSSMTDYDFAVYPTLQPDERRRLANAVVYGDQATASVVPVELRSTGAAAADADTMCLRSLSSNANARAASMALAANSALGV